MHQCCQYKTFHMIWWPLWIKKKIQLFFLFIHFSPACLCCHLLKCLFTNFVCQSKKLSAIIMTAIITDVVFDTIIDLFFFAKLSEVKGIFLSRFFLLFFLNYNENTLYTISILNHVTTLQVRSNEYWIGPYLRSFVPLPFAIIYKESKKVLMWQSFCSHPLQTFAIIFIWYSSTLLLNQFFISLLKIPVILLKFTQLKVQWFIRNFHDNWVIEIACQPILSYFMPRGLFVLTNPSEWAGWDTRWIF